jgi:prepilin-type N-terminal cleavage/methylation domain-containing protein
MSRLSRTGMESSGWICKSKVIVQKHGHGVFIMRKKGFTLIELLVVIAIIGLLLAVIVPALRKAKDYARKVICQSNYKQIGVVLGTYESATGYNFRNYKTAVGMSDSDLKRHWFWKNGTGDHSHESMPYVFQNIFENEMLPDRKVLFCPVVQNLSFEKNYVATFVAGGIYTTMDTNTIIQQYGKRYGSDDGPFFWSTYDWIWKKELRNNMVKINNTSAGAMMCDMMNEAWVSANNPNNAIGNFLKAVGIRRGFPHANVLMQDLSVVNPSDDDKGLNLWLWDDERWAGSGAD